MLVLALDSTTRQGSVALARDGAIIGTLAGDGTIAHAERLPGDLLHVLDWHGLRIADVDLFAVAAGPGSFTGLRIGIATMQGFALANGRPLAGISALEALHEAVRSQPSAFSPHDEVAIWMDAQRGQVFSAVYGNSETREAPLVDHPAAILKRWGTDQTLPQVFAGDGALAYRDHISIAAPASAIIEPVPLLAPSVARLAELQHRTQGSAPPDAIKPVYVRRSDVELARDRKAGLTAVPTRSTP